MGILLRENAHDREMRMESPLLFEMIRTFGLAYEIGQLVVATILAPVVFALGLLFRFVLLFARNKTYKEQTRVYRLARLRYALATGKLALPEGMTEDDFLRRPDAHWILADIESGGIPYHWASSVEAYKAWWRDGGKAP